MKISLTNSIKLDHEFFSVPNPINSYWAGFIAADGCVNTGRDRIEIVTHSDDAKHLAGFKELIGTSNKLQERNDGCVKLAVTSSQWRKDLSDNFNIIPQKSLTLEPPELKRAADRKAFIAGYIDGDGHIGIKKSSTGAWGYIRIYIVGTKSVLEWIAEEVGVPAEVRPKDNIYAVEWSGWNAFKIYNDLWNPRLPILGRKWSDKTYKVWSLDTTGTVEYYGRHRLEQHA